MFMQGFVSLPNLRVSVRVWQSVVRWRSIPIKPQKPTEDIRKTFSSEQHLTRTVLCHTLCASTCARSAEESCDD
eukprot:1753716-Amphidinium_carterae.1